MIAPFVENWNYRQLEDIFLLQQKHQMKRRQYETIYNRDKMFKSTKTDLQHQLHDYKASAIASQNSIAQLKAKSILKTIIINS